MIARREKLPVPLPDRVWEVLCHRLCDGFSCKETSLRMAVSGHTVDVYMSQVRARLQVQTRGMAPLMSYLVDAGVLEREA